jgi:hypothetical protein
VTRAVWDLSAGVCRWTHDDGTTEDLPVHRSGVGEYFIVAPARGLVIPAFMEVSATVIDKPPCTE